MRELIRLISSAGTGHFYTTDKNKRTTPDKIEIKKYRTMIRSENVAHNSGFFDMRQNFWGAEKIINPPTDVPISRKSFHIPVSVGVD